MLHPQHRLLQHPCGLGAPSVLVGDALYFNIGYIIKCQLGTLCMSMFEKPINGKGCLMTAEDGGLGFAAMVDVTNLTLWSRETGPEAEGAAGWAKLRVIDLKALLPHGVLSIRTPEDGIRSITKVIPAPEYGIAGIAEGTQVIFVSTCIGSYMVDLKSRQVRKVSRLGKIIFPYMSFYLPAMEAASTGQGQ
ncbi:uncharacterized protein LOC123452824 [Hordeum vulgare subsp. vulgare]|uniref:uncharacterized protein LOC123452824 n=1 Tax=Hordeum vulgare subsp. vulgare TaxID=112509 RepID=UPI001D1A5664|nr:uncharacterized protein LOC123452824 [Hordeum vulgare subsp. vulgare]